MWIQSGFVIVLLALCVRDDERKLRFLALGCIYVKRKSCRLYFFLPFLLSDICFSLVVATAGIAFALALGVRQRQTYQPAEFHGLICTGGKRNRHKWNLGALISILLPPWNWWQSSPFLPLRKGDWLFFFLLHCLDFLFFPSLKLDAVWQTQEGPCVISDVFSTIGHANASCISWNRALLQDSTQCKHNLETFSITPTRIWLSLSLWRLIFRDLHMQSSGFRLQVA